MWNPFKPFVIGDPPYLKRWFVIPRNRVANVYLHHFLRDDDDRALHDHPWSNISLIFGEYGEVVFKQPPEEGVPLPPTTLIVRRRWSVTRRKAEQAHRIVLPRSTETDKPIPCWSLFLTGRNKRSWGFWCPEGRWIHWRKFTAGPRGETVGAGCDQ